MDNFEKGREHYYRKEYEEAVRCFKIGVTQSGLGSMMWLGQCYQFGLGVEKNLEEAKDLYVCASKKFAISESTEKWLQEKLEVLKDVAVTDVRSGYIEGVGNVKVRRILNIDRPVLRYNLDEVVVTIQTRDPFCIGFDYLEKNIPELNRKWTCDGVNRFYDGYTLETDFFTLTVRRGNTDKYVSRVDGRECSLYFPENVDLKYIYVQETILKKVKDLLFKRAQVVLPQKLKEVSERINVPYGSCKVIRNMGKFVAMNFKMGEKITFIASCVQLPEESLESLCIHELAHNFVSSHGREFIEKMIELGGEECVRLDQNLFKETKWNYI